MTTLLVVLGALLVAVVGCAVLDPRPKPNAARKTGDPIIAGGYLV
jgi:hypothetical protein